ncbi:MAG: amino acid adenylation domain-containing protein, partial [bacterium]|nr:amino acid adenylation domain-containing protein [bacterium]
RPDIFSFRGNLWRFKLETEDTVQLKSLTSRYGGTLYMNLLAALNVLFHKYTGQTDIVIGSGVAGRHHNDLQGIMGMFVNTLAMRNHPRGEKTYESFLKETIHQSIRAFENQDVQFEELVDRLDVRRDPSRNPLFDISMVVQNFRQAEGGEVSPLIDDTLATVEYKDNTSKFDLTFFIHEHGQDIFFTIEYYTAIFHPETIQRMGAHLKNLIAAVTGNPAQMLNAIEIISQEEKRQLLYDFNDTAAEFPAGKAIHQLVGEQVQRNPDRIALTGCETGYNSIASLTYRKLDEESNRLARYLYNDKHLQPEERVGILMSRTPFFPVALLGALKAGGSYVPLDPSLPEARLKYMIDDASINIIISEKRYLRALNRLQWECPGFHSYLCLDSHDIHGEDETEKSKLMDRELWSHVGENAVDDITGGGWVSSYTGQPFSKKEMDEYGGNIVRKLTPLLHPKMKVLEIGCASGITMYRIAPEVGMYYGTDLSEVIIDKNNRRINRQGNRNIKLARLAAHEIHKLEETNFDLIIINSVIQCFHGHNYLRKVIDQCIRLLGNRGYLFLGDIMDLEKKADLQRELIEFKHAHRDKDNNTTTKTDLTSELFVPRAFWTDLGAEFEAIETVEFSDKIYTVENELTKFRYDALIDVSHTPRKNKAIQKKQPKTKYQEDNRILSAYSPRKVRRKQSSTGIAYVIYTSGTTGNPKGVMVEHRGIAGLKVYFQTVLGVNEKDNILQFASISFDASVWEIFMALLNGAALVMVPEEAIENYIDFSKFLEDHCITIATLPPTYLSHWETPSGFTLRTLVTAGSESDPLLVRQWSRKVNYINAYGPTETTICATSWHNTTPGCENTYTSIPIGKPILNTLIYILDKTNKLTPIGITGELCIGGIGVARGYLNRPELTAEKFIIGSPCQEMPPAARGFFEKPPLDPEKLLSKARLYRTGDLGRWLGDGNIEFLGRIDRQVKIRGFRIELKEIETRLREHETIKDAVVIDREGETGDKYLCAYYIPVDHKDHQDSKMGNMELNGFLSQNLPDYMIPSYFMSIEGIPLTAAGKVNPAALPVPGAHRVTDATDYNPPRDAAEQKLARIWSEVLHIPTASIGIDDNFFGLGGHSLKATILVSKIEKELNVKVPLADLFKSPTIRGLSRNLRTAGTAEYAAIQPVEKKDYYPVSSAQKRLHFLYQMDTRGINYNTPQVSELIGKLDPDNLEGIFRRLIKRHETFRTSFMILDGETVQKVHEPSDTGFKIDYHELEEKQANRVINDFLKPFDLTQPPLLRVVVIKREENRHILAVDMHHIISDGISYGILIQDFLMMYEGKELPSLRIQYKDWSQWQNNKIQIKKQKKFWLKEFQGEIPVLNLLTDYSRPSMQDFEGGKVHLIIPEEETAALKALAFGQEATLYMVLISIYYVLLYKLTGQEDIVVGAPTAGRTHAEAREMLGMFLNMIPLRNFPRAGTPFTGFLGEVKEKTLDAFENQEYHFEDLVTQLDLGRDTSRNPLFDVMFLLQNIDSPEIEIPGLKLRPFKYDVNTTKIDLNLSLQEIGTELHLYLTYAVKLFKPETIEQFTRYYKNIVSVVLAEPGGKISGIELLTGEQRASLLERLNADLDREAGPIMAGRYVFQDRLDESLNKHKYRTAIEYGDKHGETSITYGELDRRSDYIANWMTDNGITKGTFIGILMDDRLELVTVILGILKIGGVFIPMDTSYPGNRLKAMARTGMDIIISDTDNYDHPGIHDIVKDREARLFRFDDFFMENKPSWFVTKPTARYLAEDEIYLYFTSGTTGEPKAVMGKNTSLLHYIRWEVERFGLDNNFRINQFAPTGFDAFLKEVFVTFFSGGTLCIPRGLKELLESDRLAAWVETNRINLIHCVPGIFRLLNPSKLTDAGFPYLKYILLAGESIHPSDLETWYDTFNERIQIFNLYGLTETTILKTCHPVRKSDVQRSRIPIGEPIQGSRAVILDENMAVSPPLIAGEIYLRTPFRTYGYYNGPSLNEEKFVPNPFSDDPDDKLYKTGDLGRFLLDGAIDILGRIDRQVKLRGVRIELQGIENVLLKHPAVKEAVVVKREFAVHEPYLCAYVTTTGTPSLEDPMALKSYLEGELPAQMVPTYFISIKEIPLTINGKVNTRALPDPRIKPGENYIAPRDPVEEKLAKVWTHVLNLEKEPIGIDDNFFLLGGHSLKATLLVSRVHDSLGIKVPLAVMFKNQTIRGLSAYIKANSPQTVDYNTIPAIEKMEYYPASSAQNRLYFLHRLDQTSTGYNMPLILPLGKEIDAHKLEWILNQLISRHESLRTSFHMVDEELVQRIHPDVEFQMEGRGESLQDFVRPFDLGQAPLMRSALIRHAGGNCTWLVDLHHIISDGTSMTILEEDFFNLYTGQRLEPPELRIQYKDFSIWQNHLFDGGGIDSQGRYWLEMYKDADRIDPLQLPTDYRRPEIFTFAGARWDFKLEREDTLRLKALVSQSGGTLYMNLLAILNTFFYKYTGQTDIIIGSGIAGRPHPDLQRIMGMFINTLAIRNHPEGEKTFESFLKEVIEHSILAFENQDVQFDQLVEDLNIQRNPSRNPLFDVLLMGQNFRKAETGTPVPLADDTPHNPGHQTNTTKFDLTFYIDDEGEDIHIAIEYYTGIFRIETVQRMADHFKNIVKTVSRNPSQRLKDIRFISREEKHRVLYTFNDTEAEFPRDKTIHRLFEEQAEKSPDHLALEHEFRHLTYAQLNNKSHQLARYLQSKGAGPGSIIGISMPRSIELIVVVIAILKTGGAFLNLDSDYPEDRIDFMLKDSAADFSISDHWEKEGENNDQLSMINYQLAMKTPALPASTSDPLPPPPQTLNPDNPPHIIYTSGSTGTPKGVIGLHKGMVNRFNWMWNTYPFKPQEVCCQKTSMNFLDCMWEIFGPLLKGLPLVIIPQDAIVDLPRFVYILRTRQVTRIVLVPSLLYRFFDEGTRYYEQLPDLTFWVSSGEALRPDFPKVFKESKTGSLLLNLYGSSEVSADVTYHNTTENVTPGKEDSLLKSPIGKPIHNTRVYILDETQSQVPIGIAGKIMVGGVGLAGGYLNQPELTAHRFVPDPFNETEGQWLFQTGDLGRFLPDGVIEYLGRKDQQVKIRGFRIEPGEIESQLLRHDRIKEAVVISRQDHSGENYLCAYYVPAEGDYVPVPREDGPGAAALKEHLSNRLPDYMVPSFFVRLDKVPLIPSGKVDRKALPEPGIEAGESYIAPRNSLETQLVEIWSGVLGIDAGVIGIDGNFFEMGGHSLRATIMVSRIHQILDVKVPLAWLFSTPTIRGLAAVIRKTEVDKYAAIEPGETKEYYPLSSAQKRLLVLHRMDPQSLSYNMPFVLPVGKDIREEKLEAALNRLIARHESLRTSFREVEGETVQVVHDTRDITFETESFNLEREEVGSREKGVEGRETYLGIIDRFIRPFDLSRAPLVRSAIVKRPDGNHTWVGDMHHIIADGVSSAILQEDFPVLYAGGELPGLRLQYKDFSAWQNRLFEGGGIKRQEDYWLERFKDSAEIPRLELQPDHKRPKVFTHAGDSYDFQLTREEAAAFGKLAAAHKGTLYMNILAALNTLFYKYTGQTDIVIGSGIAGRPHDDLQHIIGMFVNILAMRNHPRGEQTYETHLKEVITGSLDAFENQDVQFEALVEKLDVERDTSRNPLFDICMVVQNFQQTARPVKTEKAEKEYGEQEQGMEYKNKTSKFDMTFFVQEYEEYIGITIQYYTAIFNEETIRLLASHFKNVITSISRDPSQRLNQIAIISDDEKNRVLYEFNNTEAPFPKDKTIHRLFEAQVKKTPHHISVLGHSKHHLTYRELNERSNRLAIVLQEKGVTPESNAIVAIMTERSMEMIIGLFGILKAGGAYLPIDPNYPRDRIQFMLKDSGAGILLMLHTPPGPPLDGPPQSPLSRGEFGSVEIMELPGILNSPLERGTRRVAYKGGGYSTEHGAIRNQLSTNAAYTIYTSGSTGNPKGVLIQHRSLVNRLLWMQKRYLIDTNDTLLQKTPFTFDVSVWELFWWSLTGARLCLLVPRGEKDPAVIAEAVEKNNVTLMHFVPSMLSAFLDYLKDTGEVAKLSRLKQVITSGEALTVSHVNRFNRLFNPGNTLHTRLDNLYGPTEATIDVSYFPCPLNEPLDKVPIGKPIDNTRLYIVDKAFNLQPVGIAGELCIAGENLARGYLNRPELTATKFNKDFKDWQEGQDEKKEIYRTGDSARWVNDGNIEFLGRIDFQVKVRGFRIELGEIENQLMHHSAVKEVVAVVQGDGEETKTLAAYIVPDPRKAPAINQLMLLEKKGALDNRDRFRYPNGMQICYINRNETDFMYGEVFEEQSYLKHGITLEQGACVFDVGANIGLFSLFAQHMCEDVKIFAFEPIPPVFELLSLNTSVYCRDVEVFQCGLSDKESEADFTYYPHATVLSGQFADKSQETGTVKRFIENELATAEDENTLSDSEINELLENRLASSSFTCRLKKLSQIIREKKVDKIDLLKIDVEKGEIDVLNGIDVGDWEKIRQLVMEVHDIEGRLEETVQRLRQLGYRVTVDQDGELKNTGLYNVYARLKEDKPARPLQPERELSIPPDSGNWLSPDGFINELRHYLTNKLPQYMVPDYFVLLDRMPLSPNGKLDRKALPEPGTQLSAREARTITAPRNQTEEKLAEIWSGILKIETPIIGIHTNFFDVGGHSLRGTTMISRIHKEFNVKMPLVEIFNSPTIAELARVIQTTAAQRFTAIEKAPAKNHYPLSSAQKRLYILQRMAVVSTAYNIPTLLVLKGEVRKERFEEIFRQLIQRHESLRTGFHMKNEESVQVIHDHVEFRINDYDLAANPADKLQEEKIIEGFVRPFDLSIAPLLRVGLVDTPVAGAGDPTFILMVDMHHIISDGASTAILVKEFGALYAGEELPPLELQYKDYSHWQAQSADSPEWKLRETWWTTQMEGEIPVLNLPFDFARPSPRSFEGSGISFETGAIETAILRQLALESEVTLYMVLLALYNIFLSRLSGQEDIIVGTPVAGRSHHDLQPVIGMFVNTLALRNTPAAHHTFNEFLQQIRERTLNAFQYQDYPFETLVEQLDVTRDLTRNPLFDVMFDMQNMDMPEILLPGLTLAPYPTEIKTAQFDMTLSAVENGDRLNFLLKYCTGLFKEETIQRFRRFFKKILSRIAAAPNQRIADIEIIDKEEKQKILVDFNDTQTPYSADKTIHGLFEEQAERTPDAIALVDADGVSITYRTLNVYSARMAVILMQKGVQPDSIVGIMSQRSLEMMIGIFGILKAGGAYLPIDPNYPQERIDYMLKDSGAGILLLSPWKRTPPAPPLNEASQPPLSKGEYGSVEITELPGILNSPLERGTPPAAGGGVSKQGTSPNGLAYVIYTSGSTGNPKGAMIAHHSLINRLQWMQNRYPLDASDTILQKTTVTFDVSVWELFWWSIVGARLCLLSPGAERDPGIMVKTIQWNNVTVMHFVPSMLNIFLDHLSAHDARKVSTLKQVFSSGEELTLTQARTFHHLLHTPYSTALANLYGPTEATIDVSYFDCFTHDAGVFASIPIGKPIHNTRLYILDKYSHLQPIGVVGELCIGGIGLARGYLNRPELTAERFIRTNIPSPGNNVPLPGNEIYKTGDVARWLPDGNIQFLGRIDHQVKIRGFRIELEEIEHCLLDHDAVKEAVVIIRGDAESGKHEKSLCACIVSDRELDGAGLRKHLSRRLPGYMVPSVFKQLDRIPLTSNGKMDHKALRTTGVWLGGGAEYVAPGTETEVKLAAIWKEILRSDDLKVGIDDNFFDLGGNSMDVVRVSGKIATELGKDIPVITLYRYTTVGTLARFLDHGENSPEETYSEEKRADRVQKGRLDKNKMREARRKRRN